MALQDRNVVLAVTGGIAAYKAAELCSLLLKSGAQVRVAMSPGAVEFIAPLTFEALTQHAVYSTVLGATGSYEMEHISWARWADALVIAPATANCVAHLACGLSDDPVSTLALCFTGPVFVAPAMNTQMLLHPATQHNLQVLRTRGVQIIDSEAGPLACGETGQGRLAQPENIVHILEQFAWEGSVDALRAVGMSSARPYDNSPSREVREQSLAGKTILITSGPTHEQIDAVRFLANPSSGKMGAALAREAAWRGATIHLVTGPVHPDHMPADLANIHKVTTAEEMLLAVQRLKHEVDAFIFAAAVSDFRVAQPVKHKIKRTGNSISLPLVENPDISQAVGYAKRESQVTIGFAAETEDMESHARAKLERKNLDAIVANNVSSSDIGFGSDANEVTIYFRDGEVQHLERDSKSNIARGIFDRVERLFHRGQSGAK